MRPLTVFLVLLVLFSFTSCKKEHSSSCQDLKQAAVNNNMDRLKEIVISYISSLPSPKYTQPNLDQLAQVISQCDIKASVSCFDCVKTLPSQTEMGLIFSYNGTQTQKIIDFSYSDNNEIVVLRVHD